jgi:hypothetical protein
MAGDWIKMRTNLDNDPRVFEMASILNKPELHVVGCLWKAWAWADEHTVDGNAVRVTKVTLDRLVSVAGFADALRSVGWLEGRDTSLSFPRFSEHNGQTAKTRALTAKRVQNHKRKGNDEVTIAPLPREEKRREELIEREESPVLKNYSEEFIAAWNRWKLHSIDKGKPINSTSEIEQLYQLGSAYPEESDRIAAIVHAIGKNWSNINLGGDHKPRQETRHVNGHAGKKTSKEIVDAILEETFKRG